MQKANLPHTLRKKKKKKKKTRSLTQMQMQKQKEKKKKKKKNVKGKSMNNLIGNRMYMNKEKNTWFFINTPSISLSISFEAMFTTFMVRIRCFNASWVYFPPFILLYANYTFCYTIVII